MVVAMLLLLLLLQLPFVAFLATDLLVLVARRLPSLWVTEEVSSSPSPSGSCWAFLDSVVPTLQVVHRIFLVEVSLVSDQFAAQTPSFVESRCSAFSVPLSWVSPSLSPSSESVHSQEEES